MSLLENLECLDHIITPKVVTYIPKVPSYLDRQSKELHSTFCMPALL